MTHTKNISPLPHVDIARPIPAWLAHYSPLLQQARWFSNNDQDREALALALAEYKHHPSLDALEQAFDSYLVLEEFKPAKTLLTEMRKLGATKTFVNLQKASYYLAQEKFAQANKCLSYAQMHKKELDNRHQAYLYFTQGITSFQYKPQTFPFTQALRYDYLLMPSEQSMCYLMRGLIRLEKEAYEAAYQDAQNSLHAHSKNDVAHYLRAVAGYYAGHLVSLSQDTEIVLKSKDRTVNKSMKNTMQKIQKLLPKEPVVIDKDFMKNLSHCFFDEVEDMIHVAEDLTERVSGWTGARFETKMTTSVQKSLAFVQQTLSVLNPPDLPVKIQAVREQLHDHIVKNFSPFCLKLSSFDPTSSSSQLNLWQKQVLQILEKYEDAYNKLIDLLAVLIEQYHVPVFTVNR